MPPAVPKPIPLPIRYPLPPEQRKPYIPQPKGKSMTIVAGFRCSDGVLLAADTEMTLGLGKSQQEKIFEINPEEHCYLAYTGYRDFIDELLPRLKTVTAGKKRHGIMVSARDAYQILRREAFEDTPEHARSFADIFLTFKDDNKMAIFKGGNKFFAPVERYAVWGVGESIGESLLSNLYDPTLTVKQVSFLAVYTLKRAKEFVEGAGGKTQIIGIRDETFATEVFSDEETTRIEADFTYFDKIMCRTLVAFPDSSVTAQGFGALSKSTVELLKDRRKENQQRKRLEKKQSFKRIMRRLVKEPDEGDS